MDPELQKKLQERIQVLEKEIERLKAGNNDPSLFQLENNTKSMAFKLSEMARLANVGFWEYEVQSDNVIWSDETYRLFDYKIGSKINYESILNRIHPDDREKHNINTQQWIERGICKPFEYRILLPRGKIKHVIAKGQIEKNDEGGTIKMLGAITDISKQKNTEYELLDYQEKLEEKVATRTLELENKQHLLNTVISEASVILFALDKHGVFTMSDGRGLKKLGLQPGEVVGMSAFDLYKDNPAIISSIETVLKGKELRTINQVGDIYFDTSFTPLKRGDVVTGVVGVATDVTELKQTEALLSAREEQYERVIDASNTGIWEWNLITDVIYYSPRWKSLIGYKDDELENSIKTWEGLLHPEDKDRMLNDLQSFLKKPEGNFEKQFRMKHKKGHYVWIQNRSALQYDSQGKLIFMSGSHQDISPQKLSEKKLKEALEYNQKMTETSPVSIVVLNKQGRIEFANQRAEKSLGLKKESITNMTYNDPDWKITDFEGNDFPNKELPFIRVQKEGKPVFDVQHAIKWPDGQITYLSINAAPKFDDKNKFDGMIATLENITERVRQEREIKEISSFREMIIKNAAEGLCVCHNCEDFPYVKFTVWNRQIEEITGYTVDEINSLGWYQSLYKDIEVREKAIKRMADMREGDDIVNEEWEITTKSGRQRVISISTSVLSDYKGTTYVLALISDVTERKKRQEQIILEKEEADKSNQLKSAFLANMSHEIRTPMNAIVGFSSFLKDREKSRDEIDGFADIISNAGNHLLNLINDIIDISKIDAGQIELNKESIHLNILIKEVYSLFLSELISKNNYKIHLKLNIPSEELIVYTDETRLKQILINLLSNAVKFTDEGTVEIGYTIENDMLGFYVSDSGIGISKEKQDKIFERFQQESNSTEKQYGGTGLGLAIAKACVEMLGGKIWVESEQGAGSTFHFNIEYFPGEIGTIAKKEEQVHKGSFNNELILIAEDDDVSYQYLSAVLGKYNLRLIRTKTGRETIKEARNRDDVSLILMDINMPDLSGAIATAEIRKQKPDLPIIAQTAYAMSGDRLRFIELGCNEYLSKPINNNELVSMLKRFLV